MKASAQSASTKNDQHLILLAILILLVIFFSWMNPRFFAVRNFVNVARQILPVVLMAAR